ncbi:MAG TPA: DNA-processing protein DprA [Acidimicrobiales bacterium]|nr:DNA-processing protein DprA [Acidimicrobiales bacterium]
MTAAVDLPVEAYLAGIVGVPQVGPAQQRELLAEATPEEAWDRVRTRRGAAPDLEALWDRHLQAGVLVVSRSHPDYPEVLRDDPEPPTVLFCRGDLAALDRRRVGVVGTRNATRYGLGVAEQLGARLGAAGVAAVSGLALGVDGAVHRGLLRAGGAPPIAVVGSGLDVVYPGRHRDLWAQVASEGLLLSELPLGMRPTRWSFPARNRIIAALSEAVVVVESKQAGGSLYTAEEALLRDRPLLAVPGPITSPTARGTNRLIADGATPMCAVDDVFVALELASPAGAAHAREPGGYPGRVLDACAHESVTLETLVLRSGLTLPEVVTAIDELCRTGWLAEVAGRYERTVGR